MDSLHESVLDNFWTTGGLARCLTADDLRRISRCAAYQTDQAIAELVARGKLIVIARGTDEGDAYRVA